MSNYARVRLFEMGISSKISHNLAKYIARLDTTLLPEEFCRECEMCMQHYRIEPERAERIMRDARDNAKDEALSYVIGLTVDTHGGSQCSADSLIGNDLEKLNNMISKILIGG